MANDNSIEMIINNLIQKKVEETVNNMLSVLFAETSNYKPVYTNKEMMDLLDIDQKTLKKYRDEGWLGYTHPYDKYYYSHDDLLNFLMNKDIRYEAFNTSK